MTPNAQTPNERWLEYANQNTSLSANARDIAIRTIIGEAANEGVDGWGAVANVLRNRARDPRWPSDVDAVALQRRQFSAWNKGAGGNTLVDRYGPEDDLYQRVGQTVDGVFAGDMPDNTGGATHYYSPQGMDALVAGGSQSNRLPRWLQEENDRRGGQTTNIGGHIFTGQAEGTYAPQNTPATGPQGPAGMPTQQNGQQGVSDDAFRTAYEKTQQAAPTRREQMATSAALLTDDGSMDESERFRAQMVNLRQTLDRAREQKAFGPQTGLSI